MFWNPPHKIHIYLQHKRRRPYHRQPEAAAAGRLVVYSSPKILIKFVYPNNNISARERTSTREPPMLLGGWLTLLCKASSLHMKYWWCVGSRPFSFAQTQARWRARRNLTTSHHTPHSPRRQSLSILPLLAARVQLLLRTREVLYWSKRRETRVGRNKYILCMWMYSESYFNSNRSTLCKYLPHKKATTLWTSITMITI